MSDEPKKEKVRLPLVESGEEASRKPQPERPPGYTRRQVLGTAALVLVTTAIFLDLLDGALARETGQVSDRGKVLDPLVEAGQLGKKTGAGIYRWGAPSGKSRKPENKGLNSKLKRPGPAKGEMPDREIVDRAVLAMLNEGARCLEEKVVASAREVDLATVFGTGFAPFRGGLLRYADSRGVGQIQTRLAELAEMPSITERPGGRARFEPAPLIADLAVSGGSFHP